MQTPTAQALRVQSLAQGLADAGIAIRRETVRRPAELRRPPLRDGYMDKLIASYDWPERELDVATPLHVGHIALARLRSRRLGFRERLSSSPSAFPVSLPAGALASQRDGILCRP